MSDDIRRLPLWKDWVETCGVSMTYGDSVTSSEMIKALSCDEDSIQFAMSIVEIRKWFRRKGMNFTSRGQNGTGYVIAPPGGNSREMGRMARAAINSMREGVVLGTSTPLDLLSPEERRLHESLTEKMATRLALIGRKAPPDQKQLLRQ